jgi:YD repeat-containing protein
MQHKLSQWVPAIVLFCGVAGSAIAGSGGSSIVQIHATTAVGTLSDARARPNRLEFIHCAMTGDSSGDLECKARDAAGTMRRCVSSDPNLLSMVGMTNNSSTVQFSWDARGECTSITIRNGSQHLPASP